MTKRYEIRREVRQKHHSPGYLTSWSVWDTETQQCVLGPFGRLKYARELVKDLEDKLSKSAKAAQ